MEKIAFIGAGSVVEAMITGVLSKGHIHPDQIWLTNQSNRERLKKLHEAFGVHTTYDKQLIVQEAEMIILCMKPKDITEALHTIRPFVQPNQLIVSVLAGVSSEYICDQLDLKIPVVRAMPNTSAAIGYSATAIASSKHATAEHLQAVKQLFETIGTVVTVDEKDLHAITALSGSGPAYIYYFVEAMEQAATELDLQAPLAKELIIQTLTGAAEMLKVSVDTPSMLRRNITSPGGTTQAGIETLETYDFQEAVIAAIKNATERSITLGSPYQTKVKK